MRISDIINEDSVETAAELLSKDEVLERLAELHRRQRNIYDPERFIRDIRDREDRVNGAISGRIAITALSDRTARDTRLAAITLKDGIEYGAPDRRPVRLVFLIAGRNNSEEYEETKTALMKLLNDTGFAARLCSAGNKQEFIELIKEKEKANRAPAEPGKEYDCGKELIKKTDRKRRFLLSRKK